MACGLDTQSPHYRDRRDDRHHRAHALNWRVSMRRSRSDLRTFYPWRCLTPHPSIQEAWKRVALLTLGSALGTRSIDSDWRIFVRRARATEVRVRRLVLKLSRSPLPESRPGQRTATVQSAACARARQSQCARAVCSRGQSALDTSASARCPVGSASSSTPAAPSPAGRGDCRRA